jgi:hypothetical protein
MNPKRSILAAVLLFAGCMFLTCTAHASADPLPQPSPPPAENQPAPVRPEVAQTKTWRKEIDEIVSRMKLACMATSPLTRADVFRSSRERSLALTKLEEAIMWLGKDLQAFDREYPGAAPNPYPESKDPKSDRVEPPADSLQN